MKLFNIEKSKEMWKKIIPPLATIILLFVIIFFIFELRFSYEDKIVLSITLTIIAIFTYLGEFNSKFKKFVKRKTIQKIKEIAIIIGIIFLIGISILSIRAYILTNSIRQLIVGIILGIISIGYFIYNLFKKTPKSPIKLKYSKISIGIYGNKTN